MPGIEESLNQLRAAIIENTEAVRAHTALLNGASISRETVASKTVADGIEKAAKPTTATGKTEAKNSKTSKKEPSIPDEDMRNAFGGYMDVDDKEDRAARKAWVATLLARYSAERVSLIPQEKRKEVLDFLASKIEDPDYELPAESDEDAML